MQPKSPLPLLAALLAGGALIFLGSKEDREPDPEEVPTSIDYEDEDLKDALVSAAEDE